MQDIERAIEDLSDDEYEHLSERAVSSWQFRFQRWPIVTVFLTLIVAFFFGLHWLAYSFWPESYLAKGGAAVVWVATFLYGMNRLLSLEFSQWLVARAIRREFRKGRWRAP